jgi:hypothetical protein
MSQGLQQSLDVLGLPQRQTAFAGGDGERQGSLGCSRHKEKLAKKRESAAARAVQPKKSASTNVSRRELAAKPDKISAYV